MLIIQVGTYLHTFVHIAYTNSNSEYNGSVTFLPLQRWPWWWASQILCLIGIKKLATSLLMRIDFNVHHRYYVICACIQYTLNRFHDIRLCSNCFCDSNKIFYTFKSFVRFFIVLYYATYIVVHHRLIHCGLSVTYIFRQKPIEIQFFAANCT